MAKNGPVPGSTFSKQRILHECSCFIEFIKRDEQKRSNASLVDYFIFFFFRNEFDNFNNAGARMLDSFFHRTLKLLRNHIFVAKTRIFCNLLRNVIMDVIMQRY